MKGSRSKIIATLIRGEGYIPRNSLREGGFAAVIRFVTRVQYLMRTTYPAGSKIRALRRGILITIPAALMLCAMSACESQQNRAPTDSERPQDGAVGGLRIVVNGEELRGIPENFYSIEALMLPLNAICDALGYKVDLIEGGLEFTVSDGTRGTKAVIGENQYTRISDARQGGDTQAFRLNRAPQLIDGGIFVPAEFFAQVLGESYLIEKGVLTFTAVR